MKPVQLLAEQLGPSVRPQRLIAPAVGPLRSGYQPSTGLRQPAYPVIAPGHNLHSSHQMRTMGEIQLAPHILVRQLSETGGCHLFVLDSRNLLTVWQANYTYQWGQVGHDWYKPLFHAAVPLLLPGDVTSELVQRALEYSTPVRQMSPWQKLLWVAAEGCRMQNLGAVVWEDVIKPLLSWEALGFLLLVGVLVAISYVGEVALVLLIGAAIHDLLTRVVGLFRQYYEAALVATTAEGRRQSMTC